MAKPKKTRANKRPASEKEQEPDSESTTTSSGVKERDRIQVLMDSDFRMTVREAAASEQSRMTEFAQVAVALLSNLVLEEMEYPARLDLAPELAAREEEWRRWFRGEEEESGRAERKEVRKEKLDIRLPKGGRFVLRSAAAAAQSRSTNFTLVALAILTNARLERNGDSIPLVELPEPLEEMAQHWIRILRGEGEE